MTDLDTDVAALLDLNDRIEQLEAERANIRARIAAAGLGTYPTSHGVTVIVGAPPRRFNRDRAWDLLTAEQRQVCVSPDDKKIKAQLPQVLLDTCMDEGNGAPRVSVK